MASYHLRNGVGEPVQCAHDPCRLHGGSDFQASNMEQAKVIAAQMVADMYSNVDVKGLSSKGDEKHKKMVSSLTNGRVFYRKNDTSPIGRELNAVLSKAINNAPWMKGKYTDLTDSDAYFSDYILDDVRNMSADDARALVDSYDGKFTTLQAKARNLYNTNDEPSSRKLAGAALMSVMDNRKNDMLSDANMVSGTDARRVKVNAGRLLNGGIDLDANYVKQQREALDKAKMSLQTTTDPVEQGEIKKDIAKYDKNIKRGTIPYLVKKRLVQNAWRNASPAARRKAIASMDPDIIRHVPPESLARSLRHRPQDERFEILDKLGSKDLPAMENAIFTGAIRQSDAMAWSNKHPTKNASEKELDTRRTINAFLRAKYVRQGNAKYTPQQAARISSRMRDTKRFTDKNGRYDPRMHAQALYNLAYGTGAKTKDGKVDKGYLPVATTIISNRALPDKAMVEFAALCDKHEETVLAHSQYQHQYASKHVNKETGVPTYMKRWHALKSVIPHLYGDVFREAKALNANRDAQTD